MNTTENILVIFLSSFLALFLLLSTILVAKLLKVVKKIQLVADKAHDIVNKVENVSEMFQKTAGPVAFGKFFMNMADMVNKHKKRSK